MQLSALHLAKARSLVQHLRIQDEAEPFLSYKLEIPNQGRISPRTLDEISESIEEYGSLLELILDLRKIWNFWKKEKSSELFAEAEEMSNKMRRQLKLLNIDMSKMKPLETKDAPKKSSQKKKSPNKKSKNVKSDSKIPSPPAPAKKSGKSVRPKPSLTKIKEPNLTKKQRVENFLNSHGETASYSMNNDELTMAQKVRLFEIFRELPYLKRTNIINMIEWLWPTAYEPVSNKIKLKIDQLTKRVYDKIMEYMLGSS